MEKIIEKNINIDALTPGMIISNDVYKNDSSILLYREGTILNQNKIDRLKKIGVMTIKVKLYESMIPEKTNEQIVVNKLMLDFNKIIEYTNYIVTSVLDSKDIKYMMSQIDTSTFSHSQKVALLSTMVGMHLENFNQEKLKNLAEASLLHDIGKSLIDYSILNKPGKLTNEEYEIVKNHSQIGYDILSSTGMFEPSICEAVLSHHENEDGTGYPNHLKETEIPLYAKIIHLCDVYSALTTKRCYKESWSSDIAIDIMEKEVEKYEPHLLQLLKTALPIYRKDDVVFLSSNRLGTVISQSNTGTAIRIFGTKQIINVANEDNKNDIYVKRKIKVG